MISEGAVLKADTKWSILLPLFIKQNGSIVVKYITNIAAGSILFYVCLTC